MNTVGGAETGEGLANEALVADGLGKLRQNVKKLEPGVLDKLHRYLSGRYGAGVSLTDKRVRVRVDVYVRYVDVKEVAINLAPFFRPVVEERPEVNVQDTRLNFDDIDISDELQQKSSLVIWDGIRDEGRLAFCQKEMLRMERDDLATLAQADDLLARGKIDASKAGMFKKNATERLGTVRRIREAMAVGKVEMWINKEDASWTIKTKK